MSAQIAALGPFELISDGSGIPAFAFRIRREVGHYSVFEVSEALRARGGWFLRTVFPPAWKT